MWRSSRWLSIAFGLGVLGSCVLSRSCSRPCCDGTRGSGLPLDGTAAEPPPPVVAPAERPAATRVAERARTPPDLADPSWTRTPSRANLYLLCWRSTSGSIPRNQDFDLEVWVLKDGAPLPDAVLSVNAWMPEHGHGLLSKPKVTAQGDGSYRIEGLLLHMRGHWQLVFDVLEGSQSEAAECALDL